MENNNSDLGDWDRNSDLYSSKTGKDDRIFKQFDLVVWDLLGNIKDLTIIDVGCGSGWLAWLFSSAGAKVTGVDGSVALLRLAQERYPQIHFLHHDLSYGLPHFDRKFDIIISHMVLMDISDLKILFASIREKLKDNGKFIFTITHPCFFNYQVKKDIATNKLYRAVDSYLGEECWRIESYGGHNHYHRSLTYYFDLIKKNRFSVTYLYEPSNIARSGVQDDFHENIPSFLLIYCKCI
jgi:SAM-dependent methyltransferase